MPNKIQRSSTARIVSIIIIFGLLPAWFFYIGKKYQETMDSISFNKDNTESYLVNSK